MLRGPLSWARLVLLAGRLAVARVLGYRVAWTIHQVRPHESSGPALDRAAALLLAHSAHVLLAHDPATAARARAELGGPGARVEVIPHASYAGAYPPRRSRRPVRAELAIADDAFVFLCFGHVRAYKDLDVVLEAFTGLDDPRAALVVAGMVVDEAAGEAVRAAAQRDPRIVPLLEFVPDERVAELFGAADAAVVARSDGGTSGALVLALSLALPVVAAETPAYVELLAGERAGWLFSPGDSASLRSAMARASADTAAARSKATEARLVARRLDPDAIAARTARALTGAPVDVLLVCSSGGHLLQLLALAETWRGYDVAWVTDDTADARSLLRDERVFFVHGPVARSLKNLLRNLPLAWRLLRGLQPEVVLTTGAATAVPFAWLGRLRGMTVVYVESISRIDRPSLACRLIAPVADRVYAQWPELLAALPRALYAGAVFGRAR